MGMFKQRGRVSKAGAPPSKSNGMFPFVNIRQLGPVAAAMTRLGQLWQRPPNTISDINPSQWPSALQPVAPLGQPGSQPLSWQYMMGQNLMYSPRPDAEYSAGDLRSLAKYPLARVCIENTKDQISRIPWSVQLKPKQGEAKTDRNKRMQGDANIKLITQFFEYPDRDNMLCWPDWVRPLLEAMLVIDAGSIYVRKTLGGTLASLVVLSGADINVLIDDNGFRPKPPSPAYQQLWEGVPRCNLTSDQLIYRPRNIVYRNTISSHLYGMSPTEQLAEEITVGALRLRYVLAFYETGSVPGIIHVVPPGVHPDKIKETMEWMNSDLAGQLEKRRQWRMIQGFKADKEDQIITLKDPVMADVFDDLHIRKICFGYGTSPQRLMRMMNRASAQQNQESAEEEGLLPWVTWLKSVIDHVIQVVMGFTDYEISFDTQLELDIVKQSVAFSNYVKNSLYSINWVHQQMGEDLDPNPLANQLLQFLPTGVQALGTPPPTPGAVGPDGKPVKPASPQLEAPRASSPGQGGGKLPPGSENAPPAKKGVGTGKEGGWIAVDWDHTLVTTDPADGDHQTAGEPVPEMVARVKEWLAAGKDVRIFTARVSRPDADRQRRMIEDACRQWFGRELPVTNVKDSHMAELWDDRAVRVARDEGTPLSPHEKIDFSELRKCSNALFTQLTKAALNPAKERLEARVAKFLKELGDGLNDHIRTHYKTLKGHPTKVLKAGDEEDINNYVAGMDWEPLVVEVEPELTDASTTAATRALALVGISSQDMISAVNTTAAAWAQERAAELVGMRWQDGMLVPNPDAKWAISQVTRDQLRTIVQQAFEKKITKEELIQKIADAGTFGPARARAIARTEISMAAQTSNINTWRQTGLVQQLNVDLSSNHDKEDECDDASDGGPYDIDKAPKLPLHTNCECAYSIAQIADK